MDRFAKNLRDRAKDLGLTNAEVARKADLSEQRFGNYVTGLREPDLSTLVRIATALETTPDHLLGVSLLPELSERGHIVLGAIADAARHLSDRDLEVLGHLATTMRRL